jgi:aubergine-like protein
VYVAAAQVISKLTFIVVSKRINTRVFQTKQQTYDNPPPGCVVDSVVTLPER